MEKQLIQFVVLFETKIIDATKITINYPINLIIISIHIKICTKRKCRTEID